MYTVIPYRAPPLDRVKQQTLWMPFPTGKIIAATVKVPQFIHIKGQLFNNSSVGYRYHLPYTLSQLIRIDHLFHPFDSSIPPKQNKRNISVSFHSIWD